MYATASSLFFLAASFDRAGSFFRDANSSRRHPAARVFLSLLGALKRLRPMSEEHSVSSTMQRRCEDVMLPEPYHLLGIMLESLRFYVFVH